MYLGITTLTISSQHEIKLLADQVSDESITESSRTPKIKRSIRRRSLHLHTIVPHLYSPPSSLTTLHEVEPLFVSSGLFAD